MNNATSFVVGAHNGFSHFVFFLRCSCHCPCSVYLYALSFSVVFLLTILTGWLPSARWCQYTMTMPDSVCVLLLPLLPPIHPACWWNIDKFKLNFRYSFSAVVVLCSSSPVHIYLIASYWLITSTYTECAFFFPSEAEWMNKKTERRQLAYTNITKATTFESTVALQSQLQSESQKRNLRWTAQCVRYARWAHTHFIISFEVCINERIESRWLYIFSSILCCCCSFRLHSFEPHFMSIGPRNRGLCLGLFIVCSYSWKCKCVTKNQIERKVMATNWCIERKKLVCAALAHFRVWPLFWDSRCM